MRMAVFAGLAALIFCIGGASADPLGGKIIDFARDFNAAAKGLHYKVRVAK